ncbi:MAG: hypothetical protein JO040_03385 [Gemmatimonadetes bacterium]|nr:hypothetical protein [Gemmatimonadota bacterium]
MRLETFRGAAMHRVFEEVREAMGDDAVIVRTRVVREGRVHAVEVTAALAREVEEFRARLEPGELEAPRTRDGAGDWPAVVAVVGPSGSGKTAALARMLADPAFAGRAGVLVLGAHRRGGLEPLLAAAVEAGAEVAQVAEADALDDALLRMCDRSVVLVDTPPLTVRDGGAGDRWMSLLRRAEPDEVHLALPAGLRSDVASALREDYFPAGPTHLLLTKLDEVPGGAGGAEIALRMEMPARWVSESPEEQGPLRHAPVRILSLLGAEAGEPAGSVS